MAHDQTHRVVIVGGGFGGLRAAIALGDAPVAVTLIDRHNYHLFQPLLYQVATGSLSPANIASPLRNLLRKQKNAQVLLGTVTGFDPDRRQVLLEDGEIAYDSLILAAGSNYNYFGNDAWAEIAPGLKSVDDATAIRRKLLVAFEEAERAEDPETIRELLSIVIVGGGPTGVEMAGAIADLAYQTLKDEYRTIRPSDARILLVEGSDRVLAPFHPTLSEAALHDLQRLNVQVVRECRVVDVTLESVTLHHRDGHEERVGTRTVIWAAGVKASPLGRSLAESLGMAVDRSGRIVVESDLTAPDHPEIFVIGDMASYAPPGGSPLPALAPVAMQQGDYVARVIKGRLHGKTQFDAFQYRDYGIMATIGRKMAVADLKGWRFHGAIAWLAWLFVHLMQIVLFENRLLILLQWAWHYVTRNRSARLITGLDRLQSMKEEHAGLSTTHAQ